MLSFTYEALPARVVFGAGSVKNLPEELDRMGAKRALILSTQEQWGAATQMAALIGERMVGLYDRAVMHVPV